MKVENIGKYDNTDFEEPTYIGLLSEVREDAQKS